MLFPGDESGGELSEAVFEVDARSRRKIDEITREKQYYQALLGGMTEGVLLVDEKGRILLVNEALQKLISIPSNVNGKTTLEIIRNVELEEAIKEALCRKGSTSTLKITPLSSGEKTFRSECGGDPRCR